MILSKSRPILVQPKALANMSVILLCRHGKHIWSLSHSDIHCNGEQKGLPMVLPEDGIQGGESSDLAEGARWRQSIPLQH